MIGTTVSHYKILEKLGGGGMGVVYKAQDLKLDRLVALKFLPPELTFDPEAKERFIHEAKAASALQHNNICTVHDIDETTDGQMFIVMDCYEGETLKSRIAKGQLRIEEATDLAIQIAQGLSEAHAHGIVHRDVKPANILITKSGVVKIVDFGLAKLSGRTKLTKAGSTLGTVAYMSPEQLQGGDVDARADIFSLGVVLYEMLTGKTPFRGDHEAALMYSIVSEEPEPLQTYIPDVTSELIHVVSRALEKDPASRYNTMEDLLIDLRRVRKETSKVFGTATLSAREHKYLKRHRTAIGLASLLLVVAVLSTIFLVRSGSPRLNPNRTTVTLQIPFKEVGSVSLSRDGNWIAFHAKDENGKEDLYWMNIAGGKPTRLTEEFADLLRGSDLSPDASKIVYSALHLESPVYKIRIVPTQGGVSRTLADTGGGAHWRPDGLRIGYVRMGSQALASDSRKLEIWSVKADGSDRRLEFTDTTSTREAPWSFCWSPDGASIAWVRNYPGEYGEVIVRELATGKERQLTFEKQYIDEVTWAVNDQILFSSRRSGVLNLWMVPAGGGDAIQVTQGGVPVVASKISADNRTLIYVQMERVRHIWISALDGRNSREVKSDDVQVAYARLSPDGEHIAHVTADVDLHKVQSHLYVMDRNGKNEIKLTSGSEDVLGCRWSPDGKWLVFRSRRMEEPLDSTRAYLIDPLNPGSPRLLCSNARYFEWMDKERYVIYNGTKTLLRSIDAHATTQVYEDSTWAIPIEESKILYVIDYRRGREGRWIVSVDAKGRKVGNPRKMVVSGRGIAAPRNWSFLIYQKQGDDLWRMWPSSAKEERIGKMPPRMSIADVSMDGREILWLKQYDLSKIVLVKNMFE